MTIPEIESSDKLYVKHIFYSGNDIADRNTQHYLTDSERQEYVIRGWRCAVCGQTKSECLRRDAFRPQAMGTQGWGDKVDA